MTWRSGRRCGCRARSAHAWKAPCGARICLAASFEVLRRLHLSPQVGLAIDELDTSRTALLLRGAAEMPIAGAWHTGLTFDFARTPIALGEVRAMLQLTYRLDAGEGG